MYKCYSVVAALLILACNKPVEKPAEPAPELPLMTYINLNDAAIPFGGFIQLDLNADGVKDITFKTQLVGDPLAQQDKRQWLANTGLYTHFPFNSLDHVPSMMKDETIPLLNFGGYNWSNGEPVLVQQVLGMTAPPSWEGVYKEASHRYMPLQVIKNNDVFNGWVELSFSIADQKLVLHRAAISQLPGKDIKAGR